MSSPSVNSSEAWLWRRSWTRILGSDDLATVRFEQLAVVVRMDRRSIGAGEDEIAVLVRGPYEIALPLLLGAVPAQHVDGLRVDVNHTCLAVLRGVEGELVVDGDERLPDGQLGALQVNISPPQPQYLAPPHTGVDRQEVRRVQAMLGDQLEEGLELFGVPYPNLRVRPVGPSGRFRLLLRRIGSERHVLRLEEEPKQ